MSIRLRLLGATLLLALSIATAADAADWTAAVVARSADVTMESGEVVGGQWVTYKNTGAQTWTAPEVRLGTYSPGRVSVFRNGTWPNYKNFDRPAILSTQAVAPGQNGQFNFSVTAPSVGATMSYPEAFSPVREELAWMDAPVTFNYTVLPSLPPTVGFTAIPAQVSRGATLEVAADATDNRAVDHVEFTVGGKTVSVATADNKTYRAQLPTDELTLGPQTVIAKAVDRVGNFATTTASFVVAQPPGSVVVDRDGDGVLATADCDDTNSAIHPGATEIPGNGIDDDCSGGDAPGMLASTVQNTWVAGRASTRITALKARNVPAGATIEIRCSGGGCPFKLKRLAVAEAGDVDLRKRYFTKAKLRVGAVLEVRILASNRIAKVARFTIRRSKPPLSRYLCLPPGAKQAAACS